MLDYNWIGSCNQVFDEFVGGDCAREGAGRAADFVGKLGGDL